MSNVKQYKVTIFGDHYSLMSDESEEAVLKAASFVDTAMKEIVDKTKLQDAKKVAILVALRAASMKTSLESERDAINRRCQKLVDFIDQELASI
jgi:cell division protein ZapA (FtsZ GTPase activity inhibitor)